VPSGSLTVVGVGIKFVAHVSVEARAAIEEADRVVVAVADAATRRWIGELNPSAESLAGYLADRPRSESYRVWVRQILDPVRRGERVCAVFFGHPGVFVVAGHEAIRIAREEGHDARMLPGISAEDCLFADLGVDPRHGCQSFEATDFLIRRRRHDPTVALVLWQVGMTGDLGPPTAAPDPAKVAVLRDALVRLYGGDHVVTLYEAAVLPLLEPRVRRLPLAELTAAAVTPIATLFVPAKSPPPLDAAVAARLGIPREHLAGLRRPAEPRRRR
jgi:uncharacterized protein YabN with tetrapyrrole methylase and pyrophosphatase domain